MTSAGCSLVPKPGCRTHEMSRLTSWRSDLLALSKSNAILEVGRYCLCGGRSEALWCAATCTVRALMVGFLNLVGCLWWIFSKCGPPMLLCTREAQFFCIIIDVLGVVAQSPWKQQSLDTPRLEAFAQLSRLGGAQWAPAHRSVPHTVLRGSSLAGPRLLCLVFSVGCPINFSPCLLLSFLSYQHGYTERIPYFGGLVFFV